MQADLSTARVMVTGASGRLGRVLIEHLLDTGAVVAGADLAGAPLDHPAFHFMTADVTEEEAVRELVRAAVERLGGLDAVIHTVGMWDAAPLAETSLLDFERMLRVNLTSTLLCFRAAARYWLGEGGRGRLVAIAAMQGLEAGAARQAAYSASKAGVVRLVEATGRELGSRGVTAAAVAPSMILFGDEPPGTAGVPVRRIASLCAYLASEAGAAHNGTVIRAYGTMLG